MPNVDDTKTGRRQAAGQEAPWAEAYFGPGISAIASLRGDPGRKPV